MLAAILVPQGMAYAELAGLPPVTGLYTTIACLVGYAIFGPSRVLVLGPGLVGLAADLRRHHAAAGRRRRADAIALAGMLAILVGLIEIGLGLGKLGFVADLLSSEVQVGYMNGLAITIIVGQFPKLFGFSTDATGSGRAQEFVHASIRRHDGAARRSAWAVLVVLLVLPRVTDAVPAVLVAVVGATIVSALARPAARSCTVGTLPRGVPRRRCRGRSVRCRTRCCSRPWGSCWCR